LCKKLSKRPNQQRHGKTSEEKSRGGKEYELTQTTNVRAMSGECMTEEKTSKEGRIRQKKEHTLPEKR